MELDAKNIIQSFFFIQRDKDIPPRKKIKLLKQLKLVSRSLGKDELRSQAFKEMNNKEGHMYKLFCQCIALTGKIE